MVRERDALVYSKRAFPNEFGWACNGIFLPLRNKFPPKKKKSLLINNSQSDFARSGFKRETSCLQQAKARGKQRRALSALGSRVLSSRVRFLPSAACCQRQALRARVAGRRFAGQAPPCRARAPQAPAEKHDFSPRRRARQPGQAGTASAHL